jgi:hypothetical protein
VEKSDLAASSEGFMLSIDKDGCHKGVDARTIAPPSQGLPTLSPN